MRCLYVDLDGTLLGRGGSLLHGGDGRFELLGARALEACARGGAEVVLMSGRRKAQVHEAARLIGSTSYVYEAGAALVLDGEEEWLTGEMLPGERSIHDQIADSGAPALLLERYAGRLEYHDPWHLQREVSHLFRGVLEIAEADALLAERGHGALRLVDNGAAHRHSPALEALADRLRVYHLVPKEASKARAVARHMQARGYDRAECIAVGDSREDLAVAGVVGAFWLVANALERDPSLREPLSAHDNVYVAEARHGAGVYEAVVTTLAQRR